MERWALGINDEFLLHPASQPNIIIPMTIIMINSTMTTNDRLNQLRQNRETALPR
jgi:hypothetical protein